jgi:hypothetical protein
MPGQVAARVAGWERTCGSWPVQRVTGPTAVTFGPGTPLVIGAKIALGADLTADPLTWVWTDITSYVRYSAGITAVSGRMDESATVTAGRGNLVLDNRDGRFSRKNPVGPYYGQLTRNTPIWVTVDAGLGAYDLIRMYVNEWPARWDSTSTDFTTPIRCGGILRRLQQGTTPISILRRTYTGSSGLVNYWPLDDGVNAASGAPVTDHTPVFQAIADPLGVFAPSIIPKWGTGTLASWLPAGLNIDTGYAAGVVTGATATAWTVDHVVNVGPDRGTNEAAWVALYVRGTSFPRLDWSIDIQPSGLITSDTISLEKWIVQADETSTATILTSSTAHTLFDGRPHHIRISFAQNGTGVDWTLIVDGTTAATGNTVTTTLQQPTLIEINPQFNAAHRTWAVGHVAVWNSATPALSAADAYSATSGHAGETAGARIQRVCDENGIQVYVPDAASTAAMGPQPTSKVLDILRNCESADLGVLHEHGFGLGYQSRAERYNAPAAMTLNYTNGDLAGPVPEPTDDDLRLRNHWTITRTDGSATVYADTASVDSDGQYDGSATVNVQTEDQALHVAQWLTYLGTADDIRWPVIGLRFDNTAGRALIPAWTALGTGARIQVTNPPDQITSDPIDVFIEGRTERVDQVTWTAQLNTTPASAYEAFVLDAAGNRGRLDLTATLDADITTTATSLSLATPSSDPLITVDAADCPFDVEIGGERITVTAVSGGSSPQTATVTRSVNTVVKAHTAGATVRLWQPGVIAL